MALATAGNALLRRVYAQEGIAVADVEAAFETTHGSELVAAAQGSLPRAVARICAWTWMCAAAPAGPDIHANQAGYAVIAQAFAAVIGSLPAAGAPAIPN